MTGRNSEVHRSRWREAALAAFLIVAVTGSPAAAADDNQTPAQGQAPVAAPVTSSADFLFGAPQAWISIRGSMLFPRAGGDLFTFVSDQLTVDKSDLRSGGFGADVGAIMTPSIDFMVGFDMNRNEITSEYRDYIASNGQPIAQRNELHQYGISAGVRFTPRGRGRTVSRYAFVPRRVVPYAGGGVIVGYYSFSQQGQFVDYVDLSVFNDRFTSDGWSVGPYLQGGADVQVWKHLFVTFDGRYTWMHADLDPDFTGFEGIDLAGFRGGTGISVVF
jgi:hypothetical protein